MDIFAFEPAGFNGFLIRVEVDIRRGIPAVDLVGLAAAAVRESRERVRAAIRNSGFEFPQDRVLINLSPADLPKEGALYDLPIASKILSVSGAVPECGRKLLIIGELTLDGKVCPVRGVLPALVRASREGIEHFVVPFQNQEEAEQLGEGRVYPISHISELSGIFLSIRDGTPFIAVGREKLTSPHVPDGEVRPDPATLDFSDYLGNENVVRALLIAAAGRHNILLFGPPGTGKTMAAMRFVSLLPPLRKDEAIEVAALWSLHGKSRWKGSIPRFPPLCAPHHSASLEGLIGGGVPPRPGEISLAHAGVLFLDEAAEFKRDVLQSLREPLESGNVTVVRAGRAVNYPADFQILLAANSCPCGNLGVKTRTCLCSPQEIQRYWKKLGGPLLDRIDIRVPVFGLGSIALGQKRYEHRSLAEKVKNAIERQLVRTRDYGGIRNARLPPSLLEKHCALDSEARNALASYIDEIGFSARASHSILKLSLTIADLDGCDMINRSIVEEAVGYRQYGDGDSYWPF